MVKASIIVKNNLIKQINIKCSINLITSYTNVYLIKSKTTLLFIYFSQCNQTNCIFTNKYSRIILNTIPNLNVNNISKFKMHKMIYYLQAIILVFCNLE